MEVNCRFCGKKIDRKTAFKVSINNLNYYFCNEEEYKKKQNDLQKNKYILDNLICILNAEKNQISLIKSEIIKIISIFSLDLFYFFIRENRDNLIKNIQNKIDNNGEFDTFYAKSKYCFGIIKNGISTKKIHVNPKADYSENIKINVSVDVGLAINTPQINTTKKRKGLDQIEDEYGTN